MIVKTESSGKVELTEQEVIHIVNHWYTGGLCPDIFQNENGTDLEDYLNVDHSVEIKH